VVPPFGGEALDGLVVGLGGVRHGRVGAGAVGLVVVTEAGVGGWPVRVGEPVGVVVEVRRGRADAFGGGQRVTDVPGVRRDDAGGVGVCECPAGAVEGDAARVAVRFAESG